MNEKELINLLKNNDQSAIKALFDTYHTQLCMMAYSIVKDKDQAKDIVQEVFIKLWRNRENLVISTSLQAYLKRAAVNTALNHIEQTARISKQELEKADLSSFSSPSVHHHVTYDELNDKANEAIANLPVRTRTVFTLIRSEEMSYKEVAETLGISMKAVEKEMMKALRLLREALKEYMSVSTIFALLHTL